MFSITHCHLESNFVMSLFSSSQYPLQKWLDSQMEIWFNSCGTQTSSLCLMPALYKWFGTDFVAIFIFISWAMSWGQLTCWSTAIISGIWSASFMIAVLGPLIPLTISAAWPAFSPLSMQNCKKSANFLLFIPIFDALSLNWIDQSQ